MLESLKSRRNARPLFALLVLGLISGSLGRASMFTEVSAEAGFVHPQTLDPAVSPAADIVYYFRGGVAIGDYDGDGWDDVFLTRHHYPAILYRNEGDGTFVDVTAEAGLPTSFRYHSMGAAFADLDNDGHPDLIVTTLGHHRFYLYMNQGDGTFREEAVGRGADLSSPTPHQGTSVAVGDFDRDGYLDLAFGDWTVAVEEGTVALHSALLRNRGVTAPGTFENVTLPAGVAQRSVTFGGEAFQFVFTPAFVDVDLDHWPDLFVSADFYGSKLFWNKGDGTFLDGTLAAGIGTADSARGGDFGDVDGDGRPDWFVTAGAAQPSPGGSADHFGNRLFRSAGGRAFLDFTNTAGLRNGGWGTGGLLLDYDNDGDLDALMVNGLHEGPERILDPALVAPPVLWENDGTGRFQNVAPGRGLSHAAHAGGVVAFDYDRDGDLDLFVVTTLGTPLLYRNDGPTGNFLRIRAEGFLSNRDGFNTKLWVQAEADGPVIYREHNPTGRYLSSGENWAHFGLGDHAGPVHAVRLRWTSGLEVTLHDVAPNQELVVQEPLPIGLESPVIEQAPVGAVAFRGQGVTLSVEARGYPEPEYLWYRDGVLVPGATGRELVLANVQPVDAGEYRVRVHNLAGATESPPARVEVQLSAEGQSVARRWNEALLDAIRKDYPAPTTHARNLYHLSAAMWDAWAAFDPTAKGVFAREKHTAADLAAARDEAISHAAYRILSHRYAHSPGHAVSQSLFDALLADLGYDAGMVSTVGDEPAALGNRIAATVLLHGLYDGANEENGYADDTGYVAVNVPINVNAEGTEVVDPNRWQPISLNYAVTQNGLPLGASTQKFEGVNWGKVKPFAMTLAPGETLYHDPGPPPLLGTDSTLAFQMDALEVVEYSILLDPTLEGYGAEYIDIGPATFLNNPLGTNDGTGYNAIGGNPVTGEPYAPNFVRHADYGRVLAEFWADGPDSETPPGHWNTIANKVMDHPLFERRLAGEGPELDPLEWDVKLYLALNGAVSDAGIAAWGVKAAYDYARPISMIRHMAVLGQSSDPELPSYHPHGLPIVPGVSELITAESSAPGGRHAHLADRVGQMALFTWLGEPDDPETEIGGVGWMPALRWSTYQLSTFVTPPFAAYVSGHSTFSRAGAEVLAAITGTPYFPGGLGTHTFEAHEWLEFERGPTETFELQWATYYDASDQAGISRIYGGIHVRADDLAGRRMGATIGLEAWEKARTYYEGTAGGEAWGLRYADWAAVRLVGHDPAPDGVVAADGLRNLELYAFGLGLDPAERGGYPRFTLLPETPARLELAYERPLAVADLDYRLEMSENLDTWEPVPASLLSESIREARTGHRRHTVVIDPAGAAPRFYRLRVVGTSDLE
jgi:hypothetical protein